MKVPDASCDLSATVVAYPMIRGTDDAMSDVPVHGQPGADEVWLPVRHFVRRESAARSIVKICEGENQLRVMGGGRVNLPDGF